jgi:hypothetical protein
MWGANDDLRERLLEVRVLFNNFQTDLSSVIATDAEGPLSLRRRLEGVQELLLGYAYTRMTISKVIKTADRETQESTIGTCTCIHEHSNFQQIWIFHDALLEGLALRRSGVSRLADTILLPGVEHCFDGELHGLNTANEIHNTV